MRHGMGHKLMGKVYGLSLGYLLRWFDYDFCTMKCCPISRRACYVRMDGEQRIVVSGLMKSLFNISTNQRIPDLFRRDFLGGNVFNGVRRGFRSNKKRQSNRNIFILCVLLSTVFKMRLVSIFGSLAWILAYVALLPLCTV